MSVVHLCVYVYEHLCARVGLRLRAHEDESVCYINNADNTYSDVQYQSCVCVCVYVRMRARVYVK